MKKIFVILLNFLIFISISFSIEFDIGKTLDIEDNKGIIEVPDIKINFDNTVTGFDLVWNKYQDIIWENDLSKLNRYTGNIYLSTGNKRLSFSGSFSGKLSLTGLKSRIYNEDLRSKLGINFTGDKSVDKWSSNEIKFDEDDEDSEYDNIKPLSPKKLTYNITGGNVFVNWIKSPDLDIKYHVLRLYRNGYFYKDFRVTNSYYTLKDLYFDEYYWSIEIMSKDRHYLSDGIKKDIVQKDTDEKYFTGDTQQNGTGDNLDALTGDNQFCIQVIQHAKNPETGVCKAFSTPCDVPEGWENVPYCKEKLDTFTGFTESKSFNYENQFFNTFQTKFDKRIKTIIKNYETEKKQNIVKIRTNILQLLKNYEEEKINQKEVIGKLQDLVIDFKLLIENNKGEK